MNGDNVTHFDSFGVRHISKEIKNFIDNKNMITNIYRMQAYNSVMWRYFCIGFTNFILKDKSSLDCTYLFSPNEY